MAVADRSDLGAEMTGRVRLVDPFGRLVAVAERRAGFLHPVLVLV